MYATVVHVSIHDQAEAKRALDQEFIPLLRGAPGFVGAYFAAAAGGEAEAFGRFHRRHERRVLGYAVSRCANSSDVADLVADTFLAALSSAGRYRPGEGDALPWLMGIARHLLARQRRSFLRRQRLLGRLRSVPRFAPDEGEAIDAAIDAARLDPAFREALSALRAKERELLLLVARDGSTLHSPGPSST